MKKWINTVFGLVVLLSLNAGYGDVGIFGSYIQLDGSDWHRGTNPGSEVNSISRFDGASLGTLAASGSLTISGGEVLIYKSGASDAQMAWLYVMIDNDTNTIQSAALNWSADNPSSDTAGGGDYSSPPAGSTNQEWSESSLSISYDLALLAEGSHALSAWWGIDTDSDGEPDVRDSNNSENFNATFAVGSETALCLDGISPEISIDLNSGSPLLHWVGKGTLQSASDLLLGDWTDIYVSVSPYTVNPADALLYYRVSYNVLNYLIVDTMQDNCYGASTSMTCPSEGQAFYGQDAQYAGLQFDYTDNGDGTVTDNHTGLMWIQSIDTDGDGDIDADDKFSWDDAQTYVDTVNSSSYAGYNDWRLPSIKEQYSLMDFRGTDPSGYEGTDTSGLTAFIDTSVFDFGYGDTASDERLIDAQYLSSARYVSTTMNGDETAFGVNFADGRIKGYGLMINGSDKTFYVQLVRGNENYGVNNFIDNCDGTITDLATGLMWMQDDSGVSNTWEEALAYCENLSHAGHDDWRLPNAKELQSILDYSRSPATDGTAAIDPLFNCSSITVEDGVTSDFPFYWTGTTHINWTTNPGSAAAYVCFGSAYGWMEQPPGSSNYQFLDVHGAGSQRSDPKTGDPTDYPYGHGPQGDVIRIYNYVRPVRTAFTSDDL